MIDDLQYMVKLKTCVIFESLVLDVLTSKFLRQELTSNRDHIEILILERSRW